MRSTRATPDAYDLEYARAKLYQAVFHTDNGQKVLKDIVERICGVGHSPMSKGDPYDTSYRVGRQDVARELLRLCNPQLDPKKPTVITDTQHEPR